MTENQNIEWKETWQDEYLKWVSGFANAKGGRIFIGKKDTGEIVGLKNAKKLMDDLPNKIKNGLGIVCEVNLHSENSQDFIEIVVTPFSELISYRGKFYLRSGSTNQLLNGTSLKEFLMKGLNIVWEEVVVLGVSMKDIDLKAVDYFRENAMIAGRLPYLDENTDAETILKKLNVINKNGEFTRAGLILFGKNPRNIETTAYIKIGKFGESSADLLIQDDIEGSAISLADEAIKALNAKYIPRPISYKGLHRVETPTYPYKAIREILFNAIIHRTYEASPITIRIYDDRIRVWSFGKLPKQLSVDDLKKEHDSIPRNMLMAKTFYMAGLIETWGRGTITILEECKKHGLLEPLIEEKQGGVAITIFSDIYNEKFLSKLNLNDRQKQAIEYIKDNGFITNNIHRERFNLIKKTAQRDIEGLIKLKMIKKIGASRSTKYIISIEGYKA